MMAHTMHTSNFVFLNEIFIGELGISAQLDSDLRIAVITAACVWILANDDFVPRFSTKSHRSAFQRRYHQKQYDRNFLS